MSDIMSPEIRWFRERLSWFMGGRSHNGKRDYDEEFGYPKQVTPQDLAYLYRRGGIASRIIRAFPQATFEEMPTIGDDDGDSAEPKKSDGSKNPSYSAFTASVYEFFDRTQSLRYLERLDRLQSIGRFGVLLMGFKDGGKLNAPLRGGKSELIYLAAYGEPAAEIIRYDTDPQSPRYGMPIMYRIQPGKDSEAGGNVPKAAAFEVHYTRVIHAAEFLEDSEVLGLPRLEPVYNHLLDLNKTLGGGAETYWRQSNPGIAFTADADAKLDPAAVAGMQKQVEEFENGLRRTLAMQGLTPNTLGVSSIADPSPVIERLLDVIAGTVGMPKRILVGSERGELASSQDADSWASRIDERQNSYATPRLILPFVGKMVETGNMAKPKGIIIVTWPDSNALSPKDQATVALTRTQALTAYANSANAEMIVPPQEFRRDFLLLEPESEFEIEEVEDVVEGEIIEGDDEQAQLPAPDADDAKEADEENEGIIRSNAANAVGLRLMARRAHLNYRASTLYIRRDLLNADEVRKHFKKQGIDSMVEAAKMHVTLAFSRTPVDWFKVGEAWDQSNDGKLIVKAGGARTLELFGNAQDILVLRFASDSLKWRHNDIRAAGASWDYPEYSPHISLTWSLAEEYIDREAIREKLEPYTGELIFGPEVFEEIKVDWAKTIKENSHA